MFIKETNMRWKLLLPVFIIFLYIGLFHVGIFWILPLMLLILNLLNVFWGEFSNEEIYKILHRFYTEPLILIEKRFSAILIILWQCWFIYISYNFFNEFTIWGVLFIFYNGVLLGCFALTLAHDLMHSSNKKDSYLSAVLLVICSCPQLAVDHILGHHKNIGLEKDVSTARINQSCYSFIIANFYMRGYNTYYKPQLYPKYLKNKINILNFRMLFLQILYYVVIVLFTNFTTLMYVIIAGIIAYIFYEIINYVQHYGLKRDSNQVAISMQLTWNNFYQYTNYILYLLPLHSAHHLPYAQQKQTKDFKSAPRLPYLYFLMVFIALIPPLWYKIMNPLVEKASCQPNT